MQPLVEQWREARRGWWCLLLAVEVVSGRVPMSDVVRLIRLVGIASPDMSFARVHQDRFVLEGSEAQAGRMQAADPESLERRSNRLARAQIHQMQLVCVTDGEDLAVTDHPGRDGVQATAVRHLQRQVDWFAGIDVPGPY